jgi:PHD/YefM family antitoxin component YafN of YafNO toxin-antitoxin module
MVWPPKDRYIMSAETYAELMDILEDRRLQKLEMLVCEDRAEKVAPPSED